MAPAKPPGPQQGVPYITPAHKEKDLFFRMVEFVDRQIDELKKLWSNKRQLAFQALNLAMIVLSALMIWKSLMVVTNSESPVVVVLRYVR